MPLHRDRLFDIASRTARLFDSLTFSYNIVLVTMFAWGVYAIIGDEPPTAVSQETSHTVYNMWVIWHVLAPAASWTGQWITDPRPKWWLRWAGDSTMFAMISTYLLAIQKNQETIYLVFIVTGLWLITLCLAIRDVIKAVAASNDCEQ